MSRNLEDNLPEPSGPHRPVTGFLFLLLVRCAEIEKDGLYVLREYCTQLSPTKTSRVSAVIKSEIVAFLMAWRKLLQATALYKYLLFFWILESVESIMTPKYQQRLERTRTEMMDGLRHAQRIMLGLTQGDVGGLTRRDARLRVKMLRARQRLANFLLASTTARI
jgi:hypothetical protein